MGILGAVIMGFFGAVFAALTMYWQWQISGVALAIPFIGFVVIGLVAAGVDRLPGRGLVPSSKVERTIMWSSMAEGVGIFVGSNIVINLHHPDLLMPAIALVVGLHFIPIAIVAGFRPFYINGGALILAAIVGFTIDAPLGGQIAGLVATAILWIAAVTAVHRDWQIKRSTAMAA